MLLTCDNCQTIFRIDAGAIGEKGRQVRCSVCHHSWHATATPQKQAITEEADMLNDSVRALRLPLGVMLAVMLLLTSLILARQTLSAYNPGLIGVYDMVGLSIRPDPTQLEVRDLKANYQGDVLRLQGVLVNLSNWRAHAAPLEVQLFDTEGQLVRKAQILPDDRFIGPADETRFFAQVAEIERDSLDITVRPLAVRLDALNY